MRHLQLEKQGLRGLAIAESFTQTSKKSILAGIVMRRDLVIDGFVFGNATISGDDATNEILQMYEKLGRPDVSYLLISGIIISMYNIIDIKKIHSALKIPIIGVTYAVLFMASEEANWITGTVLDVDGGKSASEA